jgi:hypothetical protein
MCAVTKDILGPSKPTNLWIATLWRKSNSYNNITRCWHLVFIF